VRLPWHQGSSDETDDSDHVVRHRHEFVRRQLLIDVRLCEDCPNRADVDLGARPEESRFQSFQSHFDLPKLEFDSNNPGAPARRPTYHRFIPRIRTAEARGTWRTINVPTFNA
jgi:hypothetical protein